MKKINERDIIKWTKGTKVSENESVDIYNISTDSRTIKPGDFFFPIKGETMDGNNFIEEVVSKGAKGFVTDKEVSSNISKKDVLIIKVKDTNQAFLDMAEGYLKNFKIPIIAITGSVGKTTTKDMIYNVLSEKYKVLKTEGNYNNQVGLPITVFNIDETYDIAILEMGMNSFGEIERLSKVAKPDIALITNIGDSHIGNLGSKEGILKAKSEIFAHMKEDAVVILNGDDEYLRKVSIDNEVVYVGENKENACYLEDIKHINGESTKIRINSDDEIAEFEVNNVLNYIMYPVMFSFVIGKLFKLTNKQIAKGIKNFQLPSRRYSIMNFDKNITIIDDCYNASLLSMMSAVETTINTYGDRRKIAILGDILELGSFSKEKHDELGRYLKDKPIDVVILIGNEVKHTYDVVKDSKESYYFKEKNKAYEFLDNTIRQDDVVLIKASNGNRFNEIVSYLRDSYK
ncbi:MAG TPA: UDP-N-acetylmuramoyl-tripeptide--D-alanyl-D-alanine ligase [Clostridiales bacterium]|nr:MAG: hypothetical protein A2Y22_03590 [Clostridiales bacterium GWD2_32_59]HAN10420.1 UDP-N-acetylmuramoyl-tripeptide--D-alanyl-D-alanine ligase [Clostridiales bacterium]